MTIRASLDGVILAESDAVVPVEGNAYFPPDSVRWEHLLLTERTTRCWWKGKAVYFDAVPAGATHHAVAWSYRRPTRLAETIAEHVAFGPGVLVEQV